MCVGIQLGGPPSTPPVPVPIKVKRQESQAPPTAVMSLWPILTRQDRKTGVRPGCKQGASQSASAAITTRFRRYFGNYETVVDPRISSFECRTVLPFVYIRAAHHQPAIRNTLSCHFFFCLACSCSLTCDIVTVKCAEICLLMNHAHTLESTMCLGFLPHFSAFDAHDKTMYS